MAEADLNSAKGKTVIITGSANGIGAETYVRLESSVVILC